MPFWGGGVRRFMANGIKKFHIFLALPLVLYQHQYQLVWLHSTFSTEDPPSAVSFKSPQSYLPRHHQWQTSKLNCFLSSLIIFDIIEGKGEGCGGVVIPLVAKFRGWTFEPLPYWCKIGLFGEREGSSLTHKAEEVCLSSAKTGSPATISSWRLCQHWQCCFYHPYFSLSLYTPSKRSLFWSFLQLPCFTSLRALPQRALHCPDL